MSSFLEHFQPFSGPFSISWSPHYLDTMTTFWCKGHLSSDSYRLGIGMTEYHRSFLVLKVSASDPQVCTILGISTYTKTNVRKALPFSTHVLETILCLAECMARKLGCTQMTLYDAANVRIGESFAFLTRIMLLRRGVRLYERYGYTAERDFVMPSIPCLGECRLLFRVLARRCSSWPDVWDNLQSRKTVVDDLDALFEDLGLPVETLQCWYTKSIRDIPPFRLEISFANIPAFLSGYSDRWIDVY